MIALAFLGLILVCFTIACALAIVVGAGRERPYQCEVCGGFFSKHDAVEITEDYPEEFGGSSLTATFCRKDAP